MRLEGLEVTVLGAGVAGLATARALALRGAEVTILEQADAIREVGAGLQISPNGARVLAALGLGSEIEAVAPRSNGVELIHGTSGARVLRLNLTGLPDEAAYRFVHRADLIGLLHRAAEAAGARLQLLTRIESVDLSGARPRLTDSQGQVHQPALLVAADGLHSRVHKALNGTVAPFFTHQIAWRTTIPGNPDDPAVAEVHMGPGRHLVSYPLRGGRLRNIVAVEERRRWVEEGWSLRDDPMEMRMAFKRFSPRVRGWLEQAGDVGLWGLFRHPVARVWHSGGHSVILGDAAHPMLPFLAQGANMALEDAWVLADSLARHDNAGEAFAAFQQARAQRVARVVEAANANARNYHMREPWAGIGRLGLRTIGAVAPGAMLRKFDWLYGHDVTAG